MYRGIADPPYITQSWGENGNLIEDLLKIYYSFSFFRFASLGVFGRARFASGFLAAQKDKGRWSSWLYVYNGCWWRTSCIKCLVNIYEPQRSFEIFITKSYNEKRSHRFWVHLKRSLKEKIKYFVITIICFSWYAWFSWHAWSLARRSLIKSIFNIPYFLK